MPVQAMGTYRTSDLYLSAFLKAKGLRIRGKNQTGNKFIFIFEDRDDREQLVREFFNDGTVSITVFKSALQDLKTMIYSS
ncbi:MAG: hypothetical protein H6753_07105 [Candidatus Omnitrophica bacterium]|nr:hypothetical protein [Candidatus Omnitrophota bacterium]